MKMPRPGLPVAVATVLATCASATTALACPVCGANDGASWSTLGLVASMIAIPYFVAAVAIKVIRRIDAQTAARAETSKMGQRP